MAGRVALSFRRVALRPRLWVGVLLLGLLGQLVIMGAARPGEMPRATLERLTGLVITTAPVMTTGCDMMADHGRDSHQTPRPGHDADAGCFLCPLLTLGPAVFHAAPVLPAPSTLVLHVQRKAATPRAPPAPWTPVLARGPPSVSS
ncbi:DUF2946 family protein [Acidomonas methanolica]|uniref:DUF2946 family protein n=1 Tax=Acidomonas methanolica TaxID=437 RepID=UPI002119BAB4|nr:DUF2946 family protein [Acidomonas methanolica]MCQ9155811.1 DUF2946 family protein [Acidomonas methanolica]